MIKQTYIKYIVCEMVTSFVEKSKMQKQDSHETVPGVRKDLNGMAKFK